ncbi:LPXTG cell wall anchor domain-containing protein [Pseudomarimonas arenosa]|uniref:LPXTG cell wall anchor domain-containing protein n=1 Tax=Pseudomarimonas arenosa TaxID=2774145 RepID=A0AAW3ZQR0_9GAMM|nr:LPXTG cell wall anchor domain-containing protein [Pseudomarimonas arenosa]MBD8527432.1 LPXTG cell wall anchor domain-containing protein [Pseudomarimonas arenosa]
MNVARIKSNPIALSILLAGLACATSARAQQSMDTDKLPDPAVDKSDCAGMIWNTELVSKYPRIAKGCREVVMVDGQKWARFEAAFVRANADGSFTSEFMDGRNHTLGNVTLMPRADQRATIDGRKVRFSDLSHNQKLNYYVPEGATGFAFEPVASSSEYVPIVRYEEVETVPSPSVDRSLVAQVDPSTQRQARHLPDTAGPLPFLALGGLVSLIGAGGLSLRRRLFQPKA